MEAMRSTAWTDDRLDDLNHKVDRLDQRMDGRFNAVDVRFDSIESRMDKRFGLMDARFNAVDKRFDSLESRMDRRFGEMESRMDARFDSMQRAMFHAAVILAGSVLTAGAAIVATQL
jgi:tetrahydromethanopterin S-methyltransferase subunit G